MISPLAALRWNRNLPDLSLLIPNLADMAVLPCSLTRTSETLRLSDFSKQVESKPLRGVHRAAHPHFYRRQRPTPLTSRTAQSRHQSQLGIDGLRGRRMFTIGLRLMVSNRLRRRRRRTPGAPRRERSSRRREVFRRFEIG